MTRVVEKLKAWAYRLKLDLKALYIAANDRRTPRLAKITAIAVTAYALSPIDLIPDFIPVLGYLDDIIIVPAGIAFVIKLIPSELMATFRVKAATLKLTQTNWYAAAMVVALWIAFIGTTIYFVMSPPTIPSSE